MSSHWSNMLTSAIVLILMVSVHGAYRQHPYWPTSRYYSPFHVAQPRTTPACRGNLPCYNVALTYVSDGPLTFDKVFREKVLLDHFALYGLDRTATIAEGRKAAKFFKDKYGFDFTNLNDEAYLTGVFRNHEGISFRSYVLSVEARYRLYTASYNDEAQFFNKQISDAGWIMEMTNDIWGRGSFNKLIPGTAFMLFGSYVIKPCDDKQGYSQVPCKNILNPSNPTAPIVINFKSKNYFNVYKDPDTFNALDCIVEHPVWGIGNARGYLPLRFEGTTVTDGRNVLTFPSIK